MLYIHILAKCEKELILYRSDYEKNYNKSQHMVLEINVLMISEELMCKTKRNWKFESVGDLREWQ